MEANNWFSKRFFFFSFPLLANIKVASPRKWDRREKLSKYKSYRYWEILLLYGIQNRWLKYIAVSGSARVNLDRLDTDTGWLYTLLYPIFTSVFKLFSILFTHDKNKWFYWLLESFDGQWNVNRLSFSIILSFKWFTVADGHPTDSLQKSVGVIVSEIVRACEGLWSWVSAGSPVACSWPHWAVHFDRGGRWVRMP